VIHRVHCDKPSFHTVDFQPGFNVVLADKTRKSTRKHSRNSSGKSTLVEIIHYCLGGDHAQSKFLKSPDLHDWTFSLDFDLAGKRITASRNTASPSRIKVSGEFPDWPVDPKIDEDGGEVYFDQRSWNRVLGVLLFGLRLELDKERYKPSFRSMISYFMRRRDDAFIDPIEHFRRQAPWDSQVNTAFLLGLDWDIPRQFQLVKDRKKALKDLKAAAKTGYLESFVGAVGKLRAELVKLKKRAERKASALATFKVIEEYRELEQEANSLTAEIHKLQNANVRDQRMLARYKESIENERAPEESEVEEIYRAAGLELPDLVQKRLDDVRVFHDQIVSNRKEFLKAEIDRLERDIGQRRTTLESKIESRASILKLLESGGALEEYSNLQESYSSELAKVNDVKQRIDALQKIQQGQSDLKIENEMLQQRARLDLDERTTMREKAIALFGANSEALHESSGELVIDVGPAGLKFDIHIEGLGGTGINKTNVFAYDLMLAKIWCERKPLQDFLIHDSYIFDGVDERQRAIALELAAQESQASGFQYICTLNSDAVPLSEFTPDFNLDDYVRLKLTDAKASGTLTGIRFRVDSKEEKEDSIEDE